MIMPLGALDFWPPGPWELPTSASFQKYNLETWAQTLGDLKYHRAF